MKRKIRLTENKLKDVVKESIEKVLKENVAMKLDYYEESVPTLMEMAKLNLKDNGTSEFPSGAYRVWVQGDNSPHKPPYMHISSFQEGWEIKVFIENGDLWQIVKYGKRNGSDKFLDVIKLVKSWFRKNTCMPGRIGTNQEAAQNEWEACNTF